MVAVLKTTEIGHGCIHFDKGRIPDDLRRNSINLDCWLLEVSFIIVVNRFEKLCIGIVSDLEASDTKNANHVLCFLI